MNRFILTLKFCEKKMQYRQLLLTFIIIIILTITNIYDEIFFVKLNTKLKICQIILMQ